MNKNLFLLTSATIFALAPMALIHADAPKDNLNVTVTTAPATTNNDEDVATAVKKAFSDNQGLAPYAGQVDVKSDKGVVTLSGFVSTEQAKADFANKAKDVPGVVRVVDNIVVKGPAPMK